MGFNIVAVSWHLIIHRQICLTFLLMLGYKKLTDTSIFFSAILLAVLSKIEQKLKEYAKSLILNKFP